MATEKFATEVAEILALLRARGESLSVAESLTGGLLGGALTQVAGSSDVFLGGVVAYNARIKSELLDIPAELIADRGVVSGEVAVAMASAVARITGSDWAIATTGVAGPGASEGVPAGTVWIAIAGPEAPGLPLSQLLTLHGGRQEIRIATIARALEAFTRILRG
ncbi:MAG: CinA family protein [Actinobacteria bacterium]|nr:CinA family protein [Actinomycetota bacterium]